ncbi:unnamed protein product [Mytilus edulis]|uniref:Uncharacterized protein n=1 Tax=Mytilus edulis TaxID=6550 RepID=A0A8S3R309_MYTED|nr:unnamed protein product [Mytilus edulis]
MYNITCYTRKDDMMHHTNGQIVNALIKQNFYGRHYTELKKFQLIEHNNMYYEGQANEDLLQNDLYHLNDKDCHCILEWEMSSKFTVDDNDCNINMFDKSPNFIWSDESPTNFQTALLLPDIQTQIDTFNKSIIKESQSSVDEAAAELSHIFLSAATNSLKRNKLRNKKIKTKNGLMEICTILKQINKLR